MTPERLAEIQAIENATRPGPWTLRDALEGDGFPGNLWVVGTDEGLEDDDHDVVVSVGDRAVGAFIETARTAIPELLAEIDRLQRNVAALTQTIHAIPDEIANGAANLAHARAGRDRLAERVREFEASRQRALATLIASRDLRGDLYLDLTCRLCDRGVQWRDAWSTADESLLQAIAPDADDAKDQT